MTETMTFQRRNLQNYKELKIVKKLFYNSQKDGAI